MDAKTGAVLQHRGYDVFGRPRDIAAGNTLLSGTNWQGVTKGYTDHEHLIDQELIHMNGRIYDFNIGRFLSVDPFLQFPENSQSANPYSYILNNPMSGTDPTGYSCAGSNLESVCDSYYKDNGIVTESMKLTNMVSQTLNNSTSKTSSGQANKLQMAQSGGAGKQESKDVGLQTLASKSSTNVGGDGKGEPEGIKNDIDPNEDLLEYGNIELSKDGKALTVNANVYADPAIKKEGADWYIKTINDDFKNAEKGEYAIDVNLTLVRSLLKADLFLKACFDCASGGFVNAIGGTEITYPTKNGMFVDTPTHEFFHILGAYHQPNKDHSIRSYSGNRRIKQSDLGDVVKGYSRRLRNEN
nr:RHS repeat-associated core domain-containing protein [Shewanella algicola]